MACLFVFVFIYREKLFPAELPRVFGNPARLEITLAWLTIVVLAICFDLTVVAALRAIVRNTAGLASLSAIIGSIAGGIVIGSFGIFVPMGLGILLGMHDTELSITLAFAMPTVALSNTPTLLLAVLTIVLALLMLVHQLLWPLLARPIYFLATADLGAFRRIMFTIGSLLAVGSLPDVTAFFGHLFSLGN